MWPSDLRFWLVRVFLFLHGGLPRPWACGYCRTPIYVNLCISIQRFTVNICTTIEQFPMS